METTLAGKEDIHVSEYQGINIDYGRDSLMTEMGMATWRDRYRLPNEKSPQESIATDEGSTTFASSVASPAAPIASRLRSSTGGPKTTGLPTMYEDASYAPSYT